MDPQLARPYPPRYDCVLDPDLPNAADSCFVQELTLTELLGHKRFNFPGRQSKSTSILIFILINIKSDLLL